MSLDIASHCPVSPPLEFTPHHNTICATSTHLAALHRHSLHFNITSPCLISCSPPNPTPPLFNPLRHHSLSRHDGRPHLRTSFTSSHLISPLHFASLHVTARHPTSPHRSLCHVTSPHIKASHLTTTPPNQPPLHVSSPRPTPPRSAPPSPSHPLRSVPLTTGTG